MGKNLSAEKSYFTLLVHLARIDGDIDEKESLIHDQVRKRLGLSKKDVQECFEYATEKVDLDLPEDLEGKMLLFLDASAVTLADGDFDQKEQKFIEKLGAFLDWDDFGEYFQEKMTEILKDDSIMDSEVRESLAAGAAARLKKGNSAVSALNKGPKIQDSNKPGPTAEGSTATTGFYEDKTIKVSTPEPEDEVEESPREFISSTTLCSSFAFPNDTLDAFFGIPEVDSSTLVKIIKENSDGIPTLAAFPMVRKIMTPMGMMDDVYEEHGMDIDSSPPFFFMFGGNVLFDLNTSDVSESKLVEGSFIVNSEYCLLHFEGSKGSKTWKLRLDGLHKWDKIPLNFISEDGQEFKTHGLRFAYDSDRDRKESITILPNFKKLSLQQLKQISEKLDLFHFWFGLRWMDIVGRRTRPSYEEIFIKKMDTPFRLNYWRSLLFYKLDDMSYFDEQMKANSAAMPKRAGGPLLFKQEAMHNSFMSLIGDPDGDIEKRLDIFLEFLSENEIIPVFSWMDEDESPSLIRHFMTDSHTGQKFSIEQLIGMAIEAGKATEDLKILLAISQSSLRMKMFGYDKSGQLNQTSDFPVSLIITDQFMMCCYDDVYPSGWLLIDWNDGDGTKIELKEFDKSGKQFPVFFAQHTDEFAANNKGHKITMLCHDPTLKDIKVREGIAYSLDYFEQVWNLLFELASKYAMEDIYFELDTAEKVEKFRNKFLKYYEKRR